MMRAAVIVLVAVTVVGLTLTLAMARGRPERFDDVLSSRPLLAAGGGVDDDVPGTTAPVPGESAPLVTTTMGEEETIEPGEAWEFAVNSFMEDYDLSAEVAEDMLVTQGILGDYADTVDDVPGFAGFMVVNEPPNVFGVIAVTPGTTLSPPPDLPITVIEARVAEDDSLRVDTELVEAFHDAGARDVGAVTYDPFEDAFIVWRDEELMGPPLSLPEAERIIALVPSA